MDAIVVVRDGVIQDNVSGRPSRKTNPVVQNGVVGDDIAWARNSNTKISVRVSDIIGNDIIVGVTEDDAVTPIKGDVGVNYDIVTTVFEKDAMIIVVWDFVIGNSAMPSTIHVDAIPFVIK